MFIPLPNSILSYFQVQKINECAECARKTRRVLARITRVGRGKKVKVSASIK